MRRRGILSNWNRAGGFTLVELKVSTAIGAFILAGALSSYLVSVKGLRAVSNYSEIHRSAREAVNNFAKDMRSVYGITTFSSNSTLSVTIPTNFTSSGSVNGTKTVTYTYTRTISNGRTNGWVKRFDSSTGVTSTLATNVYFLEYRLYDHLGTNTTLVNSAKSVSVEMKLNKFVIGAVQTEAYISARMDMRNKP